MEKPILLWDRSQCREQVCTCHDDGITPRFCTGCGCNVASPGHRNTLDVIDRQASRIRELEGALAESLKALDMAHARLDRVLTVGDWPDMRLHVAVVHSAAFNARRVLSEGSVTP